MKMTVMCCVTWGRIFKVYPGQVSCMVAILLFILGREMNAGIFFFTALASFFSAVESKGEFGLAKARGTLLFCVCV